MRCVGRERRQVAADYATRRPLVLGVRPSGPAPCILHLVLLWHCVKGTPGVIPSASGRADADRRIHLCGRRAARQRPAALKLFPGRP